MFVLVGLAVAAICVGLCLFVRRRRRRQKLERDAAVSASLAAAGFKRTDLDDEDDVDFSLRSRVASDMEMGQRSGSRLARSDDGFSGARGRVGEPNSSPTLPQLPFMGEDAFEDPFLDDNARDRRYGTGHVSSTSYEPLLAAFAQAEADTPSPETRANRRPPTPPPRNPLRALRSRSESPTVARADNTPTINLMNYSSDNVDRADRFDSGLLRNTSIGASTMRDERDYSRPVLAVRNITDLSSSTSL